MGHGLDQSQTWELVALPSFVNIKLNTMDEDIDAGLLEEIPQWILDCPVAAHWVKYNGVIKFAMLNYERSIAANQPMIDLCYCATAGLINGRVEKTVRYDKKKFKMYNPK